MSHWVFGACDLCGETEGEDLLALRHADAPGEVAFIRQCHGCGLKRLWPRPGVQIIHRYYASDSSAYAGRRRSPLKQAVWDFLRDGASGAPGRGRTLRPLRPFFRLAADWAFDINVPLDRNPLPRILDVGCGFGDLLLYWKSKGAETLGVDFDGRAVSLAEKLGLRVLLGELEEQNLPAESFDVVVFNHSLEHLPSPLSVLRQAAGLVRRGGTIHLAIPNGGSVGLEVEAEEWGDLSFPIHFWFFDSETLSRSLELAGFRRVRLHSNNMWRGRLSRLKFSPRSPSVLRILKILNESRKRNLSGDIICATAIR
jgi:SAM-dependent methyltransferase